MTKTRIGINGFGRIGRTVLRNALEDKFENTMEVVAINDPFMDLEHMAYLFKFDSVHRRFKGPVEAKDGKLFVNNQPIHVFHEKEPSAIKWGRVEADYIVESTGIFTTKEKAKAHLNAGAKKVIISAPSDDAPTFVCGVNLDEYKRDQTIISNGSSTTNAVALLARILNEKWGIVEGSMTTLHSTTASQKTVDGPSQRDWRGGRSVNNNIIPASTGAAQSLVQVMPELDGKLIATDFRVPNNAGSLIELVIRLKKEANYDDIIETFKKLANRQEYKEIMAVTEDQVVSSDWIGSEYSVILDAKAGLQLNSNFVKLVGWYDNEWGYSRRICDLIVHIAKKDNDSK